MGRFVVSNSGLRQFYSGCPAKYTFYKKYNLAILPPPLIFGLQVHKMVEEGLPQPHKTNMAVYEIASKLLRMVKKLGYKIIDQEIDHLAPLTDDIWVAGRIDAVAELEGEPVLIDFKTGAYGWKKRRLETGEIVYFQAMGTQGTIYTTPPIGSDAWPDRLDYLLASSNGRTQVHTYYNNEEDRQNLIRMATIMKDASDRGWFPKVVNYQCHDCNFMHACWKTPNWEQYYVERGEKYG